MRAAVTRYLTFYIVILCSIMSTYTQGAPRVLVYSATAGYRHDSIPTAIASFQRLGPQYGIAFDFTEDKTWFNDTGLAGYDCILFLSNSDEVLDDPGKQAFDNYLQKGGNFVGVHSASACLFTTEFFGKELGAWFDYHPDICNATIVVLDPTHPSTAMLPARWEVYDEMYNFKSDPRDVGSKVILTVDESTYVDNGTRLYDQGTPHPIAWYQDVGAAYNGSGTGGRSWYTSLGHTNDTWQNATYLSHVMEGLKWALGSNTTLAFNPKGSVGNAGNSAASTGGAGSAAGTGTGVTGAGTSAPSASASAGASHSGAGAKQVVASVAAAGVVAAAVGAAVMS